MVEHVGAAVLADVLGIVADQAVALAGDAVLHLACRRELEALLDAALGLQFGHFVSFATTRGGHLGTATAALLAGRFDSSTSWKGGAFRGGWPRRQDRAQGQGRRRRWIPAYAGMTRGGVPADVTAVATRPRPSPG